MRNYLLIGLKETDQKRLYDKYWYIIELLFDASDNGFDSFLRDYMALEQSLTEQIRIDQIYDEFKVFLRGDEDVSLEARIEDMLRVARSYASFIGTAEMNPPWLADAMTNMRSLNTTQGLLVMRLYDYHQKEKLSDDEFTQAIKLIESYLLRRAVIGLTTRNYWSVFARMSKDLHEDSVFESLKVAFARLPGNNRFPNNEEFKRALQEHDLYGLRVCKHILDRLENDGQSEPSPVKDYTVEHFMPVEIKNVAQWKNELGDNWLADHGIWLHRLGNLTLTAYNSKYSNRPFKEKQTIEGGFNSSAVRLNSAIRDVDVWSVEQIKNRGEHLATNALSIWPEHAADAESIQAAVIHDLEVRETEKSIEDVDMDEELRHLIQNTIDDIREITTMYAIIEGKSLCSYGPEFFAEFRAMSGYVRVMLPLDYDEIRIPLELKVTDLSGWKKVPLRNHNESNLLVDFSTRDEISILIPLIRHAVETTCS